MPLTQFVLLLLLIFSKYISDNYICAFIQNGLPNVGSVDGGAGLRGAEPRLLCGGEFHCERRL